MESFDQKRALKIEIDELISLGQESGYWDFKKQWYENRTDLLHDIICMANNLENRDAYIIIGVDEENDYSIVDTKDDTNRKNTQKIVDFLKDKKFAGGIRPVVHVEPLDMGENTMDVIVIENSHNTPFFLVDQFEGVRANHIYTRVMDTNTPIDKSADINHIEYLWRKRFYIDETPLAIFSYYLSDPYEWASIEDADMGFFCKKAPEYTIICERDPTRDGYEYYLFGQVNSTPSWWYVTLKYHQTAIERFLGISLDSGRSFVVAPCREHDLYKVGISFVGFFVENSLKSRLLAFFHQKETVEEYSYNTFLNAVIVFRSDDESKCFFEYVKNNCARYHELYTKQGDAGLPYFPVIQGLNMDAYKKEYRDALVLQKMLLEFRNQPTASMFLEETTHADA